MKLKKIIAVTLSVLMLLSLMGGCKNDKEDNENAADSSTEAKCRKLMKNGIMP